ncbi:hypothetical protein EAH79_07395 [Sphingomonas koreensis]|nr:hypothetical protein EAH79_07395 [Sphingomonas koreensis]
MPKRSRTIRRRGGERMASIVTQKRREWLAGLSSIAYRADPERLIALGRLFACSLALLSVYLDPTTPSANVTETYAVLFGYVVISVVFAIPPLFVRSGVLRMLQTPIDVLMIGLLAHYTDELESPFFGFCTFALIGATIRWGWRGALGTAALLQIMILMVGIPDLFDGNDWPLNVLIMRTVFCWVAAMMLGYFGSYRSRNEYRLRELASWPIEIVPTGDRPWLSEALNHAATVLGTDRILVLWQDQDATASTLAFWTGERCQFLDDARIPMELSSYERTPTVWRRQQAADLLDTIAPASENADWHRFLRRGRKSLHLARFDSIRYRGWVIVIDPAFREESVDSLVRIVAARIGLALEQFSIVSDLSAAAGLQERARLTRDLHDSVLQDLTAAVWQLDAAMKQLAPNAQQTLSRIHDVLQQQQYRLRRLVTDTRAHRPHGGLLMEQLQTFAEPLGRQWNCRLELSVEPPQLRVSNSIATELCLALSEATANAARHGAAEKLTVSIVSEQDNLRIEFEDDGNGADGRAPLPRSMSERVAELGGTLIGTQRAIGHGLRMTLPLHAGSR